MFVSTSTASPGFSPTYILSDKLCIGCDFRSSERIVCRNNIVYLSAPQCGNFSALRLARTIAEFIHFGVQNCKRRCMTDAFLIHDALEVSLESE